ncbi:MAG: hypothetical protein AB8B85_15165 [Paracoccaceae bacterium]
MKPLRKSFRISASLLAAIGSISTATPAMAQTSCPSSNPVFETTDRCRATFVDVLTGNRKWLRIKDGQRICFVPGGQDWEWKCRGISEESRCRRIKSKRAPLVSVHVRDGEVSWSCHAR